MEKRKSAILIPLVLVVLAAVAVWWGIGRLTSPRPLRAATVDSALLESQDPIAQWLLKRQADPAPAPPDLALGELALDPSGPANPVPELGQIWQRVQQSEQAARIANPLPMAGGGSSGLLLEQVHAMAAAFQQKSELRDTVIYDQYLRAVDDYWPSYPQWLVYQPLITTVRQRALATGDRNLLTSPYLKMADLQAEHYRLEALADRTRWEATRAAFLAKLKVTEDRFDGEWNLELDGRLRAMEATAASAAEPNALVAPGILGPVPNPDAGSLAPEYAAMVAEHRSRASVVELALLYPSAEQQLDDLREFATAYQSVRQLRYEAALAGEGLVIDEGGEDLTEAIGDLLNVQPERAGGTER